MPAPPDAPVARDAAAGVKADGGAEAGEGATSDTDKEDKEEEEYADEGLGDIHGGEGSTPSPQPEQEEEKKRHLEEEGHAKEKIDQVKQVFKP